MKAKEILKRRKSVKNTKKITRTMQMVSTAKFKKASDRIIAARPYGARLMDLVREIGASVRASGTKVDSPLLELRPVKKIAVLVLTANRGLCGGYNNNVIRAGMRLVDERQDQNQQVRLDVSGKKGLGFCRFFGRDVTKSYTEFEDKPTYDQVEPIAQEFLDAYTRGEIDELHLVYTAFVSSARQNVTAEQLLPLSLPEGGEDAEKPREYIFEPSAGELLASLIPEAFKTAFFTAFLHAAASEQVSRMVAMKNATDAADDMIKDLTRLYNRARQTQITMEIAELLGGSEALKEG